MCDTILKLTLKPPSNTKFTTYIYIFFLGLRDLNFVLCDTTPKLTIKTANNDQNTSYLKEIIWKQNHVQKGKRKVAINKLISFHQGMNREKDL